MRILLAQPGKLNTVPMGRFVRDALARLGHEVVDFNLSSRWFDKLGDRAGIGGGEFHGGLNRRFRRVADAVRPDLVLAVFGFDLSAESLDHLKRRNVPRVCWWLNDPFQFKRSLAKAGGYDFLFTNALGSVADYRAAGIGHAHWLPTACEPAVHRPLAPAPEYRCDVCFAGDWNPMRQAWCEALAQHFDLRVFGPWKRRLRSGSPLWARVHDGFFTPDEMARMFGSAKVVFNLHSWYGKWDHGTNPRLFEAAGCGSCQVVDWKREIPELFHCDDEVVTYRDMDELTAKVRQLVADDARREDIARRAQARAYAEHTYEARMKSLLAAVGAA